MYPLAPHYERKTRADQGNKRPRKTNASSSSTTQNPPSSSLLIDAMVDENDDESFHSNSPSPSQHVSSSSNVGSRVRSNSSHESHDLNTFLSETITLQTQQRDVHREGFILHDVVVTTPKGLLWTSSPKSLEAWIYLPSCGKLLCLKIFFILSLIFKQNILEMSRFGLVTLM
ncbi:hypothetical protein Tco_0430819 [Tanacetum coccineum]